MARRSPMNERYQKNTAPGGKTRRSAASAKPKRDLADESSKKASVPKGRSTSKQPLVINPPTPEFAYWRRVWWILLVVSLVFTFSSIAVRKWLAIPGADSYDNWVVVANILLGLGYGGIFAALYIDWTKLRSMRKEWTEQQRSGKAPKAEKAAAKKPESDADKSDDKS
jgi:hypothetical protein